MRRTRREREVENERLERLREGADGAARGRRTRVFLLSLFVQLMLTQGKSDLDGLCRRKSMGMGLIGPFREGIGEE